jgi:CMP-N,N'-diacetyllegionaminic acid synthase
MKITAIIPCRSGSKGIIDKNIKLYKNKPLIAHSIELALKCDRIDDVVVSTDSEKYADIARKYGAKVPFLRPPEISGDLSSDFDFLYHYLIFSKDDPNLIVQLRPTYPNRSLGLLNKCLDKMMKNMQFDSLRTVVPFEKSPYKMYQINNNQLLPLFKYVNDINEPYNQARQMLPQCYLHNGCIDIIKSSTILKKKSCSGDLILPFIMNNQELYDIDSLEDWTKAENACLENVTI